MSKDTARKEVEQVCFAYEKAGKTGNKKDWGEFYDLEEPLIKKVEVANQPKLSIPKKIANKLDNEDANSKAVLDWVFATEMIVVNNEKALERREDEILKRRAIVSIYGASKALGVDLVEVTDE